MAQIPVEHNRRKPWWWWVIGLLIAATLIWLLLEALDPDPEVLGPEDEPGTESVMPPAE